MNLRAIVGTCAAIAGASVVAVALSGGSYALWVDANGLPAGSVQSGTIGLTATESFTAATWSNMLVGESVRQPFTLTNSGTVGLSLSAVATTNSSFAIRVASGACPGTALTGTPASTSATSLGTLAAGASKTVCLEVTAVTGATAATSSAFSVVVTGTQS